MSYLQVVARDRAHEKQTAIVWEKCKRVFALGACIAVLFLCALFACSPVRSPFARIEHLWGARVLHREFYLYSASSQARIEPSCKIKDIFCLQGQSVILQIEGESKEAWAVAALQELQAETVIKETSLDRVSYYAYSTTMANGGAKSVFLGGKMVNLHIAYTSVEGDRQAVLGTPIIFGGY
jgi:hypothetical protein